ncbi:hypothetical protein GCM10011504_43820 [Siccirubricoccus deserti]|nr:hypothetical protein GCM10011504_43820 [Siccirubricoccus deserti]
MRQEPSGKQAAGPALYGGLPAAQALPTEPQPPGIECRFASRALQSGQPVAIDDFRTIPSAGCIRCS